MIEQICESQSLQARAKPFKKQAAKSTEEPRGDLLSQASRRKNAHLERPVDALGRDRVLAVLLLTARDSRRLETELGRDVEPLDGLVGRELLPVERREVGRRRLVGLLERGRRRLAILGVVDLQGQRKQADRRTLIESVRYTPARRAVGSMRGRAMLVPPIE